MAIIPDMTVAGLLSHLLILLLVAGTLWATAQASSASIMGAPAPLLEFGSIETKTELGQVRFAKNVGVSGAPKKVDEKLSSSDQIDFGVAQPCSLVHHKNACLTPSAGNEVVPGQFIGTPRPFSWVKGTGASLVANPNLVNDRWRLSMIHEEPPSVQLSTVDSFVAAAPDEMGIWLTFPIGQNEEQMGPFDIRQRIGGFFGGFGGDASGFVGSDQEKGLEDRGNTQNAGEHHQPPSIISDTIVRRFLRSPAGAISLGGLISLSLCLGSFLLDGRKR